MRVLALLLLVAGWLFWTLGRNEEQHNSRESLGPEASQRARKPVDRELSARDAAPAASRAPRAGVLVSVSDVFGGQVEGAQIELEGQGVGRTNADGHAWLAADEEPRTATARASGYAAQTQLIPAGSSRVALVLLPESLVAGWVESPTGRLAGVKVTAASSSSVSGSDGTFVLRGVPPGTHEILAHGDDWSGRSSRPVRLGVGESVSEVVIPVMRTYTLRGVILAGTLAARDTTTIRVGPNTAPVVNWEFEVTGLRPGQHQALVIDSAPSNFLGVSVPTLVDVLDRDVDVTIDLGDRYDVDVHVVDDDENSIPEFELLVEARVGTLAASRPCLTGSDGICHLSSLPAGPVQISSRMLSPSAQEFRVPVPGGRIRLQASTVPSVLDGRVTDSRGQPLAGRLVQAVSSTTAKIEGQARSNQRGIFAIYGIPAGTYEAQVWDARESRGEPPADVRLVELAGGQSVEVHFALERKPGAVSGIVRDASGVGVLDALVRVTTYSQSGTKTEVQAFSDEAGRFHVESAGTGMADLRASHPEFGVSEVRRRQVGSAGSSLLVLRPVGDLIVVFPRPLRARCVISTLHHDSGSLLSAKRASVGEASTLFADQPAGEVVVRASCTGHERTVRIEPRGVTRVRLDPSGLR